MESVFKIEDEYLMIQDEDGEEWEFEILDQFQLHGKEYMVIVESNFGEDECYIMRVYRKRGEIEELDGDIEEAECEEVFEEFIRRVE